jgi:hypothetical protein
MKSITFLPSSAQRHETRRVNRGNYGSAPAERSGDGALANGGAEVARTVSTAAEVQDEINHPAQRHETRRVNRGNYGVRRQSAAATALSLWFAAARASQSGVALYLPCLPPHSKSFAISQAVGHLRNPHYLKMGGTGYD